MIRSQLQTELFEPHLNFLFYYYLLTPTSPSSPHILSLVVYIYTNDVVKYSFIFPHAFLQKKKKWPCFLPSIWSHQPCFVLGLPTQMNHIHPAACYHNLPFDDNYWATTIVVICHFHHHHMTKNWYANWSQIASTLHFFKTRK